MTSKGAEVKHLLSAVRAAWEEFGKGYEHYTLVARMLTLLADAHAILDDYSAEILLPLDAANRYKGCVHRFLMDYQRLAHAAELRGDLYWSMPSKLHWFWHLADRAKFWNPRRTNCLLDEDFVGKHKILVHACSPGTELHKMPEKASERYRWAMHFQNLRIDNRSV